MTDSSLSHLHSIREFELQKVISVLPTRGHLLEIGAGTGHQALALTRAGYSVLAVDIASSAYADCRVFPVVDYDGAILPVATDSIDVVFTSNVLEHVRDISALLKETIRVLTPTGLAVHILPTPTWRLWTILTHYPWLFKRLVEVALLGRPAASSSPNVGGTKTITTILKPYLSMLYPARHGERGTTLTELHYFSRRWWTTTFRASGFSVEQTFPIELFYTGSMVLAHRLPVSVRSSLSRLLGPACMAYVLRPNCPEGLETQTTCTEDT